MVHHLIRCALGAALLSFACNYDFQQFVAGGGNAGMANGEGGSEANGARGGASAGSSNAGGANAGKANAGGGSAGGKSSAGGSGAGGKANTGGASAGGASAGAAGRSSGGAAGNGGTAGGAAGGKSAGGSMGSGGSVAAGCAGEKLGGVCWYLSDLNQSCSQACANHGGVASSATSYVGVDSQGGSLLKCSLVLALLGVREAPNEGNRTDGVGLGCHVFPQATRGEQSFWLSSPEFSPTARLRNASIACGCAQ